MSETDRKKEEAFLAEYTAAEHDNDGPKIRAIMAEHPELEDVLYDLVMKQAKSPGIDVKKESMPELSEAEQAEMVLLREFMAAAFDDRTKAKAMLADHPELLNARRMSETALHFLAVEGHADVVDFLATIGFDVNTVSERGHAPLIEVAGSGHEKVVEVLLAHGANPNATSSVWGNALANALQQGFLGVVQQLLDAGAKLDYVTEFGETWRDHLPRRSEYRKKALKLLAAYGAKLTLVERVSLLF